MFQASPPSIQCQLCPLTFSDPLAMSAHYNAVHVQSLGRRPHPDAKHECDVCGRKFVQKNKIKRHKETVHGVGDVKSFKCDVCSRVFNRSDVLASHKRTVHKMMV